MIMTSQMPVARWHGQIGDPTVADGILDRLVHNAHRIETRGDPCGRAWQADHMIGYKNGPGSSDKS
jgi:hypothetical protein